MIDSGLQLLLEQGENLVGLLEQETAVCLKTLETISADDLTQFLEKRQKLAHDLMEFDNKLRICQSNLLLTVSLPDQAALQDFKHRVVSVLQGIIRMEGLLRALAEQKMILISEEIISLSRGLKALRGYHGNSNISSFRDFIA